MPHDNALLIRSPRRKAASSASTTRARCSPRCLPARSRRTSSREILAAWRRRRASLAETDGIHARAGRARGPAGGAARGAAAGPAAGLSRDAATGQSDGPGRPAAAALRDPRAGARTRTGSGIEYRPAKSGRKTSYPIAISRRRMGRAGARSRRPTFSGSSASNPRRVSPTRRRGSATTSPMPRGVARAGSRAASGTTDAGLAAASCIRSRC